MSTKNRVACRTSTRPLLPTVRVSSCSFSPKRERKSMLRSKGSRERCRGRTLSEYTIPQLDCDPACRDGERLLPTKATPTLRRAASAVDRLGQISGGPKPQTMNPLRSTPMLHICLEVMFSKSGHLPKTASGRFQKWEDNLGVNASLRQIDRYPVPGQQHERRPPPPDYCFSGIADE